MEHIERPDVDQTGADASDQREQNEYLLLAKGCRDVLEHQRPGSADWEETARRVKALEAVGQADELTRFKMFDTGAFHYVVKGYVKLALERVRMKEETREKIFQAFCDELGETQAEKADQYYWETYRPDEP